MRRRLKEIRSRLEEKLNTKDPHGRLRDKPVSYRVISGHAFQITYRDVPQIDEHQVLGVKKIIGEKCYCTVEPQSDDKLIVRFVIPV